jgi:hypothetical protein
MFEAEGGTLAPGAFDGAGGGTTTGGFEAVTAGGFAFGAGGGDFGAGVRGSRTGDRGSFPGFPDLESRPSIFGAAWGALTAGAFVGGGGAVTTGGFGSGFFAGTLTTGGFDDVTAGGFVFGANVRGSSTEDRGSFWGFPILGSRTSIFGAGVGTLAAVAFVSGGGGVTTGGFDSGFFPGALTTVGFDSGFFAGTLTTGCLDDLIAGGFVFGADAVTLTAAGGAGGTVGLVIRYRT